jgi:hypothetical protein
MNNVNGFQSIELKRQPEPRACPARRQSDLLLDRLIAQAKQHDYREIQKLR